MTETPDPNDIAALLSTAGLPREFRITGLPGGGNNRVYRLDCAGTPLLLKAYFHHRDDPRDRLAAEFAFSRFAWDHGLRCLPQPLARDDRNHLGLYEFIPGRPLEIEEVGPTAVGQALAFFHGLNQHKHDPAAQQLPRASEACFTLTEHLDCVERRIARLAQIDDSTAIGHAAAAWVHDKLQPTWNRMRSNVIRQAAAHGIAMEAPIAKHDRCLSPSDFGFHNAILADDGSLRFVDFEYAGWDDPAKTVCDFVCQPKLPVPEKCAARFTREVLLWLSDGATHKLRITWLLGVYRLKWCCIMMNEFLPLGSQRRSFAQDGGEEAERKRMQLDKAQQALQRIEI
jgi:phosphotransferase family enzyme